MNHKNTWSKPKVKSQLAVQQTLGMPPDGGTDMMGAAGSMS
jgi:hypothetical protein